MKVKLGTEEVEAYATKIADLKTGDKIVIFDKEPVLGEIQKGKEGEVSFCVYRQGQEERRLELKDYHNVWTIPKPLNN